MTLRRNIGSVIAAALLASCGQQQQPLTAPGVTPAIVLSTAALDCSRRMAKHVRCNVLMSNANPDKHRPSGLSPEDLQSAYRLPSKSKGAGQIVAIVDAYDNPNVASDLAEYRSTFKLPVANFTKYNQEGETSNYPQGSEGWGVEIDLDVEMVSASCPNCTIYLIEANSSNWSDIETAEAEAVTLGAHIVSNSFGGDDADKKYFKARGVTYLGSGDDVEPAVFNTVVAVGGTDLFKDTGNKRGWSETPWGDDNGGCFKKEPKPPWQHDSYCKGRLTNDVSAVADIEIAEYDTYGEGGWFQVGGVSAPTGLLAGVFGLAGNAAAQRGGRTFWEPKHQKHLYPVGGAPPECKYAYGNYSTCTGWGSPHGIDAF
jgi:hypothetical protein